jgi:nitroreductase
MSAILERRSVRNFLPKAVENEKMEHILRAGFEAPSAHNRRPWEFLVINKREDLDAIAGMSPYSKMCTGAAAAIVPCVDLKSGAAANPDDTWWVQDLSAATENILLQIVDEGLGGVWLGWYPDKSRVASLSARFKLPSHIVPFSVIAFGYPSKESESVNRYDSKKVHYGVYGQHSL